MSIIQLPYGKSHLELQIPDGRLLAVLESKIESYQPTEGPEELVREAMGNPIGSQTLTELAHGKKNIVILASDHTRPVPSRVIIPLMLEAIRRGNPDACVTILISTGCHRETTQEEIIEKLGEDIASKENIRVHACDDSENLINMGCLPSGGELWMNRIAVEADLLVAEGFIEPHFFAGYSGGRKSVLPGIAGRQSVLANHCAEFIAHPMARTGILDGNPIHRDMVWAAEAAKLAFIVNVVINSDKDILYAVAGSAFLAHEKGCEFLSRLCRVKRVPADIVITTNGGYPLDQNIYQAVKGMTAAEASVNKDGVIIIAAKSNDGHGGDEFFRELNKARDLNILMESFLIRGRNETRPDQWQSQIFIRVLQHAHVVYVSDAPDEIVAGLHMIPAHSMEEALQKADRLLEKTKAKPDAGFGVTVIPNGVGVIIE